MRDDLRHRHHTHARTEGGASSTGPPRMQGFARRRCSGCIMSRATPTPPTCLTLCSCAVKLARTLRPIAPRLGNRRGCKRAVGKLRCVARAMDACRRRRADELLHKQVVLQARRARSVRLPPHVRRVQAGGRERVQGLAGRCRRCRLRFPNGRTDGVSARRLACHTVLDHACSQWRRSVAAVHSMCNSSCCRAFGFAAHLPARV